MESPSNNDSYHTGEETSDNGDDSDEHNLSDVGGDCDDVNDDEKNNVSKTRRKSTKKKGKSDFGDTETIDKRGIQINSKAINHSFKAVTQQHFNG